MTTGDLSNRSAQHAVFQQHYPPVKYPNRYGWEQEITQSVLASHAARILSKDIAMADQAQIIALRPTGSARENLVRQQAMLVEIHDTIRHTSELILGSQQLIRQLDWMSDAAWHRASRESLYPQKEKA
jgi:hypothetical protein